MSITAEEFPILVGLDDNGNATVSNYWSTNFNRNELIYILVLEHKIEIFAPDSFKKELCNEIESASTIEFNHGVSEINGQKHESLEVIFDDKSSAPYSFFVVVEQQAKILVPLVEGQVKALSVVFSDGSCLSGPATITTNQFLPTLIWEDA